MSSPSLGIQLLIIFSQVIVGCNKCHKIIMDVHRSFLKPKAMYSNCLFCLSSIPKRKDIQFSITQDKEGRHKRLFSQVFSEGIAVTKETIQGLGDENTSVCRGERKKHLLSLHRLNFFFMYLYLHLWGPRGPLKCSQNLIKLKPEVTSPSLVKAVLW